MHLSPTLLTRAKAKHILHWLVAHYWARGLLLPARLIRAHLSARHPAERHHPRGGRAIVVLYVQGASGQQPDRLPARPPIKPTAWSTTSPPPWQLQPSRPRCISASASVWPHGRSVGSSDDEHAGCCRGAPASCKHALFRNLNAVGKPAIPIC